jgi:putative ABC transport system permease protein
MANLAAANMMHRKTRTAVSVLAVAIEVAMVMILVGLADGTLNDIAQRLENVGADVLFQPPDASLILGVTTAVMPTKYMELIRRVEGVADVTPVLNWHVSQIKGQTKAVNLWAVDYPSFSRISGGLSFVLGQENRPLENPGDLAVDTMLSETTGLRLGDTVEMLNTQFKVAGVFKAGAGGRFYARLQDIQEAVGASDKASFFLVEGVPGQDPEALAKRLLETFKGHKITPMTQVSRLMRENTIGLREFKQALTGMAVIISFMVVLLAMYTAIIERTREIGILRAIGASQGRVVQFVIGESLLICIAGVVVGIGLALAGRWTLVHVFPTQAVQLTQEWALIASSLGIAGGVLGSVYPALRAARMDPVQALNFE